MPSYDSANLQTHILEYWQINLRQSPPSEFQPSLLKIPKHTSPLTELHKNLPILLLLHLHLLYINQSPHVTLYVLVPPLSTHPQFFFFSRTHVCMYVCACTTYSHLSRLYSARQTPRLNAVRCVLCPVCRCAYVQYAPDTVQGVTIYASWDQLGYMLYHSPVHVRPLDGCERCKCACT